MTKNLKPLSREALRLRYGSFYDSGTKLTLQPSRVPSSLRPLIPYAEIWGISDDLDREQLVLDAPEVATRDLEELIDTFNEELNAWLAGPEADSEEHSPEYIAFSAMRMARYFV